ncbi:enoyl-CoA hydratase/isomerase family protein [Actinophytocola sp.]|uniref:enoyl-CoA hydratase/isomerase family protein n=1 Tax=Actinophytocola sp. TaxID=1872138 RepID=UPI002ED9A0A0
MSTGISITELADGAAGDPLLGNEGRVVAPLFVVDVDAPAGDALLERAECAARRCDRILVGVTGAAELDDARRRLAGLLDLTLAPHALAATGHQFVKTPDTSADAATLDAAARANPQAALVLGHLLRTTGQLDVGQALDVESLAYSTLLGGAEFRRWLARRGPRPVPPAAGPVVLVARTGGRLHVTLNRPERRNAYGREVRDALVDALRIAELDPTVERVVLDGAGPSFCSGGDLDEFGTAPDLATAHLVRTRAGAGLVAHAIAGRLEVHVHGSCVGAGIELPAFAGRIIARPGTTFQLPEVGMGLVPGAGGTVSLPRRIGRWRTLFLALSGRPLDAATARDWGLVDEVDGVEA